ncbi:unnamed protein product [Calypogeia fissa]
MYSRSMEHNYKRRPPGHSLKADKGKGVHRVPSLEELDHYGGRFKKDQEYYQSKELDPMEYAYLIQKEFVSSIRHKRSTSKTGVKKTPMPTKGFTMESLSITNHRVPNSKRKIKVDMTSGMTSLQHLDLATGWESSRQVLVEEVISSVFATAKDSADLSKLQRLGLPARYLPTIAEAIQAEHLSQFKHLDLANTGSLGQKSLELRKLVERRLPAFLSCKILPYS